MTPTSLFETLKNTQKDFNTELADTYKRLDSGAVIYAATVVVMVYVSRL